MLSLLIALGALVVICDSLCAWHDATHGITGIYALERLVDAVLAVRGGEP